MIKFYDNVWNDKKFQAVSFTFLKNGSKKSEHKNQMIWTIEIWSNNYKQKIPLKINNYDD